MRREFHYTNKLLKNRRRQLRNTPTATEKILWKELRNNKLGVKFTRQYSIDGYVLDFYCQSKRFAIELEGSVHEKESQIKYDEYRFRYIRAHDIKILRIKNEEVITGLVKTLNIIRNEIPSYP